MRIEYRHGRNLGEQCDGSHKYVIGEIYLTLQIGPIEFLVLFQVMDISITTHTTTLYMELRINKVLVLLISWQHIIGHKGRFNLPECTRCPIRCIS